MDSNLYQGIVFIIYFDATYRRGSTKASQIEYSRISRTVEYSKSNLTNRSESSRTFEARFDVECWTNLGYIESLNEQYCMQSAVIMLYYQSIV